MSGKHSRSAGDSCNCSDTQITHTCSKLNGKANHNYTPPSDEQTPPKWVDTMPPTVWE